MPQVNDLSYSDKGMQLTKQAEGLVLNAYQDQVGVWTIGYGHTGREVKSGLTITEDLANDLLKNDVGKAVTCVNRNVTVALNQNQFDALVDFVFNLGCGKFKGSTLLKKLNAADFVGAAAEFAVWRLAGGKIAAGLVKRRAAEAQLFQQPVQNP